MGVLIFGRQFHFDNTDSIKSANSGPYCVQFDHTHGSSFLRDGSQEDSQKRPRLAFQNVMEQKASYISVRLRFLSTGRDSFFS